MSEYEIYHYGVKGMRWGVRRKAKKDAKEFARAKMYYGEGAGNRRKLIKATVNERSKDPDYKKAFDYYSGKQDMSKHASRAKAERKINDTKSAAAKTGRGVVNILTGHPERLGAAMMTGYMAYSIAHKTGADRVIAKVAKDTISKVVNEARTAQGRYHVEQLLRNSAKYWGK